MAKGDWKHMTDIWRATDVVEFSKFLDQNCEGGWELHKMSTSLEGPDYNRVLTRFCVFRRRIE